MAKIFISYRRSDTGPYADRLAQRLASFQFEAVFLDREDIELGDNYADRIRAEIAECDAVLVLVGKGWIGAEDSAGHPRLTDPKDWVRREVTLGLSRHLPVIPVLFDAPPPFAAADLPSDMAALATAEGYDISGNYFDRDADDLARRLEAKLISTAREGAPASVAPRATVLLRQLQIMWLALFAVTIVSAIAPTFVPALQRPFWIFPGTMTLAVFVWRLYWLGESMRPARARFA